MLTASGFSQHTNKELQAMKHMKLDGRSIQRDIKNLTYRAEALKRSLKPLISRMISADREIKEKGKKSRLVKNRNNLVEAIKRMNISHRELMIKISKATKELKAMIEKYQSIRDKYKTKEKRK